MALIEKREFSPYPYLSVGNLLLVLMVALVFLKPLLPAGLVRVPESLILPFADWFNAIFNFVKDDLGLIHATRAFAAGVEWLLDITANLLYGKNRWPRIGPIPWIAIALSAFVVGYALKGWKLALFCGGTFIWIALLGQWKWAMETLSVIVVAAPIAVLLGLITGVIAWRRPWFEKLLRPVLNIAQSLPHFAYMIPVVVFIGVGPKAGAIVTIIFATPPMIRMTLLGLKQVPTEVEESGQMCGANKWQSITKVSIPTARNEILVGVNQVIMQCLAMVVLASFIGMPGLGQKLLQLLQALKIGRSIEIGITIVLLAVMLDRCSKAWVEKQPVHHDHDEGFLRRHKLWLIWCLLMIFAFTMAYFFPSAHILKRADAFTISKELDAILDVFLIWVDPFAQSLRAFLITSILIPMRDSYLWLPVSAVLVFVAWLGWRIGGRRSAVICVSYILFIALSGWWDRAMITVYMVSFAVFVAIIVGLPIGVWASKTKKRAGVMLLICDTAQTFPSFIYLIPVIMLFGVNDVAAIAAVVIFAMVPIIRYTIEGLRGVPSQLIEASEMSGATYLQTLWNVRFPLALPTIMVGLNQTVMFSLFMVIIAAFIGTQDLGQEMQRALSSTDVGKGLTLGLCVAFIGLLVDHLIMKWSHNRNVALGLE